jgi:hypothetical protein
LTGKSFFPHLIAAPFHTGLRQAFAFAAVGCVVAGAASWSRGRTYVDRGGPGPGVIEQVPAGTVDETSSWFSGGQGSGDRPATSAQKRRHGGNEAVPHGLVHELRGRRVE